MIEIKFDTDNESFQNGNFNNEIKYVLTQLIKKINRSENYIAIIDSNGNRIGVCKIDNK
jgi:hypothetical protein